MANKYQVKVLAFTAKNSQYTVDPGIYDEKDQDKEIWKYLTSLGEDVCQVIIGKEVEPKSEAKAEAKAEPPKSKQISNKNQGDN